MTASNANSLTAELTIDASGFLSALQAKLAEAAEKITGFSHGAGKTQIAAETTQATEALTVLERAANKFKESVSQRIVIGVDTTKAKEELAALEARSRELRTAGVRTGGTGRGPSDDSPKAPPSSPPGGGGGVGLPVAALGIAAAATALSSFVEKGKAAIERTEELRLGFATTGLAGAALEAAVTKTAESTARLSNAYAVSKGAITEATAVYLKFGGSTDDLGQKQELIIGLSKRAGIGYEQAAKALAKGTDPEIEAQLTKIGIKFDKNATSAERMAIIQAKVGGTLSQMKEQANGPLGAMNRLENAWAGIQSTIGVFIITVAGPLISVLGGVGQILSGTVIPAMQAVAKFLNDHKAAVLTLVGAYVAFRAVVAVTQMGGIASALEKGATAAISYAQALVSKVIPGIFGETAAKGVQAGATEVATVAQEGLNLAMLASPIGLIAIGIGAAIGAFMLFKDKTKDLATATKDADDALVKFKEACDNKTAVDNQSKAVNDLADRYDALKNATDPKSQAEFADVAKQLAAQVPQAAEAVDKLNAAGQLVGSTYKVTTEEVRNFSAEQAKLASERKADAEENLASQAAGLIASLHKANEEQESLNKKIQREGEGRKNIKDVVDMLPDVLGDIVRKTGAVADLTERSVEYQSDLVTEHGKTSEEIQKSQEKLREVVTQLQKQGLTVDQIAQKTRLTTAEVKKYGVAVDAAGKATAEIVDSVSQIADEFDKAEQAANAFMKTAKSAAASALQTYGAQSAQYKDAIAHAKEGLKIVKEQKTLNDKVDLALGLTKPEPIKPQKTHREAKAKVLQEEFDVSVAIAEIGKAARKAEAEAVLLAMTDLHEKESQQLKDKYDEEASMAKERQDKLLEDLDQRKAKGQKLYDGHTPGKDGKEVKVEISDAAARAKITEGVKALQVQIETARADAEAALKSKQTRDEIQYAIDLAKQKQAAITATDVEGMRERFAIEKEVQKNQKKLLSTQIGIAPEKISADLEVFDATTFKANRQAEIDISLRLREEEIAKIGDLDEQDRETKLLAIDKQLQADLDANKLNESKKIQLLQDAAEKRYQIEHEFRKKTDLLYATSVDFITALETKLTAVFKKGDDQQTKDKLLQLRNEQQAVRESVASQVISRQQGAAQDFALQKQIAELTRSNALGLVGVLVKIREAAVQTFSSITDQFQKKAAASEDSYIHLKQLGARLNDQVEKAKLDTSESGVKKYNELLVEQEQSEKAINKQRISSFVDLGSTIGSTFLKMAVEGHHNIREFAKAGLGLMFDYLEKLVPILSAQILGLSLATPESILTFGTAALIEWAGLTAILEGAVAGVRGIVGLQEGASLVASGPSRGDRHLRLLDATERVVPGKKNREHWDIYEALQYDPNPYRKIAHLIQPRINFGQLSTGGSTSNLEYKMDKMIGRLEAIESHTKGTRKSTGQLAQRESMKRGIVG